VVTNRFSSNGSLSEAAWCVKFTWKGGAVFFVNTTKKSSIRTLSIAAQTNGRVPAWSAIVYTSAAVEYPFRRLEDAVAAALILDGEVVQL
jgi:hypothetical protein